MADILPRSLLRVKRGICPRCGLPLPLDDDAPTTRCAACGCDAIVERRLRTTEPEVAGAPLRQTIDAVESPAAAAPQARWIRSAQFRQGDIEHVHCPGCGVAMTIDERPDAVEIVRCDACGTDSRFERRLVAAHGAGDPPQPRQRSPDEPSNLDDTAEDDPASEHLAWRLMHERDADLRVGLALNLLRWRFVNRTMARFVPALLADLHRPGAQRDQRFEQAIADGLALLSNHGDPFMRDAVLVAAEPWMFRGGTSRALIASLGLGAPIGLKLLLDSAEWSSRNARDGATGDEHAAACLNAVNWIFQRNFEAHAVMGEVLLYRMLYLSGSTLAFALGVAQRRITGTGFHFNAPTLLRFIDDAEAERPALVPELERAMYVGRPADGAALRARLQTFHRLRSSAARAAALRHDLGSPEATDDAACAELVTLAAGLLDDHRVGGAAAECLARVVAESTIVPESIHALVAARGDALPPEVRRHYLAAVPGTPHLSAAALPYWTPSASPADSPEFAAAMERWKGGLAAAIERDQARRAALTEFWSARASSPEAAAVEVWGG